MSGNIQILLGMVAKIKTLNILFWTLPAIQITTVTLSWWNSSSAIEQFTLKALTSGSRIYM
jgi:hypothetical protein